MALRISDDELNPGQIHADNTFDALKKAETNGNSLDNSEEVKDKEQKPASDWVNNVTGQNKNTETSGLNKFKSFAKKKGATIAIIAVLLGGGIGIGSFLSTGLLLVQIKETLFSKLDTARLSSTARSEKIIASKLSKSVNGSSESAIADKFNKMSKVEVDGFKKAGVEVTGVEEAGLTKVEKLSIEGKAITSENFVSELKTNNVFSSAMQKFYNSKLAIYFGDTFDKVMSLFRISKKAPTFQGEDYDTKMTELEKITKEKTAVKETAHVQAEEDINPSNGKAYSEAEATLANENINTMNELVHETGGGSTTSKILNGAEDVATGTVNVIKITGIADEVCTLYRTSLAIGYAAKTVRAMQLAFYAMMFLNVADQIKAGVAKDTDVSFLGSILTKESTDDYGQKQTATDSFGYKYAAYGQTNNMPTSAMQYMTAAGFSGLMVGFIEKLTPGVVDKTCKVLGNPIVGFLSLGVGVAFLIVTLGQGTATLATLGVAMKAALKSPAAWAAAGIALGEVFLPGLLKDIIAGNLVDKNTVGAYAGDAITSGSSAIMGTTAKYGGNSPLTPAQAVAYNNMSNEIAVQDAKREAEANPFDLTNKNTFVGSIAYQLIPYISKMSSLSTSISSVASIVTGSIATILPKNTSAATDQYTMCSDVKYRELGIATDPFCNIIYGIPTDSLNDDPIAVINTLLNVKDNSDETGNTKIPQIDSTTGQPIDKYTNFVSECINRTLPLGNTSDEITSYGDGSECLFGKEYEILPARMIGKKYYPAVTINNKFFYIHYIDQRIQDDLDGTDTRYSAYKSSGVDSSISFFDNYNYNTTALNMSGN